MSVRSWPRVLGGPHPGEALRSPGTGAVSRDRVVPGGWHGGPPITNGGFPFNEGVYVLNMYTGMAAPQAGTDNLYIFQTIEWTVGDATIQDVGSGELIATVVVPESGGQALAGGGTAGASRALLATMGGVLVLLVGVVGWAVRRLLTAG